MAATSLKTDWFTREEGSSHLVFFYKILFIVVFALSDEGRRKV